MTTWDEWELRQRGRVVGDAGVCGPQSVRGMLEQFYETPAHTPGIGHGFKVWWANGNEVDRPIDSEPDWEGLASDLGPPMSFDEWQRQYLLAMPMYQPGDPAPRFKSMVEYLGDKGMEVREVAYWNDTWGTFGPSTSQCGRCKRMPAAGYATIGDTRYCHGDDDPEVTCYMQQGWDNSGVTGTNAPFISTAAQEELADFATRFQNHVMGDLTYTYDPDPAPLDLAGKTITVHYPNGDTREVTFGDAVERDDDDEFTITLPVLRVEDQHD